MNYKFHLISVVEPGMHLETALSNVFSTTKDHTLKTVSVEILISVHLTAIEKQRTCKLGRRGKPRYYKSDIVRSLRAV